MSGHTPGPWVAVERVGNLVDINYGTGAIANVALWSCGKAGSPEENAANARLIAAAPELLEALYILWREVVASGNGSMSDFGWREAREKTLAAIAKAEGR